MEIEVSTRYVTADSLLFALAHRPWMPPNGPWALSQRMRNGLFLNYAIEPAALRPLVPEPLSIDVFGGAAWLTVMPFYVAHLRGNGIPALPMISSFGSAMVRTCVIYGGKPGLFVFSVDSGSLGAVWAQRLFWRLPYWHAKVRLRGNTGTRHTLRNPEIPGVQFEAERLHGPKATGGAARFSAVYETIGEAATPLSGTLEHFLTDRYCVYTQSKRKLYRIENHHLPFTLQQARVDVRVNTLCEPLGLMLPPSADAVFCVRNFRLLVWPAEKLT